MLETEIEAKTINKMSIDWFKCYSVCANIYARVSISITSWHANQSFHYFQNWVVAQNLNRGCNEESVKAVLDSSFANVYSKGQLFSFVTF